MFMQYPGSMRLQPRGREGIVELADMIKERLIDWACKLGRMPSRMLFYRDGVSESQYKQVRENEITQVQEAFHQARDHLQTLKHPSGARIGKLMSSDSPQPFQLTFIVVGKRHKTRFYPKAQDQTFRVGQNLNGNVKPGLVVDQVITHSHSCDFYLQSHQAVKGTARAAHYFTLKNDMKLSTEALQDIVSTSSALSI